MTKSNQMIMQHPFQAHVNHKYIMNCFSPLQMKKILIILVVLIAGASAFRFIETESKGAHEVDPAVQKEVLKVLDDYMNTFNAKDAKAWQNTYHFPHFRLASGTMSVLEKYGDLDATVFDKLKKAGWDHSKWDHRNVVQGSSTKVHVDTRFSRYRIDGSLIGTYESLYVLTLENGKWGVKLRSSYAE